MDQKIYSSDDSLNDIIYQELKAKSKANPEAGLPVADIKRELEESFSVMIGNRSDFHPLQKIAFDDISLVQAAKGGLEKIEKSILRLQELGLEAMRNISSGEREHLNEEYQYLKSVIKTVGKETSFGGISLLDVNTESLEFRMHPKTRTILGADKFLFSQESLDEDEDEYIGHGLLTGREAAQSIQVLRQGLGNISQIYGALGAVENRIVTDIKDFALQGRQRLEIEEAEIKTLALDTANSIFREAETALDSQNGSHLSNLSSKLS